jgi:hypothetical protein
MPSATTWDPTTATGALSAWRGGVNPGPNSGVPLGGTVGSALVKNSNSDGDVVWGAIVAPADAAAGNKGLVQLAGDLGGTAAAPTVPGLVGKQATLVSGSNLKTVGGVTLLGAGDVPITTADATSIAKGVVQLAGDLGGTAASPTVPGLVGKQPTLVSGSNLKTVGGVTLLGSGDIPIVATLTDATGAAKGVVQLAGDLGGTAAAPTVPALATKATVQVPVPLSSATVLTLATHGNRALYFSGATATLTVGTDAVGLWLADDSIELHELVGSAGHATVVFADGKTVVSSQTAMVGGVRKGADSWDVIVTSPVASAGSVPVTVTGSPTNGSVLTATGVAGWALTGNWTRNGTVIASTSGSINGSTTTYTTVSADGGTVVTWTPTNLAFIAPGISVAVSAVVPGQVTGLTAGAPTTTTQPLSWSAPSGTPTDYFIEYKASASPTWLAFTHAASSAVTTTITGLTAATSYDYRVSAINGTGTGAVSSVLTALTASAVVLTLVTAVVSTASPFIINLTLSQAINSTMPVFSAFAIPATAPSPTTAHPITAIAYIDATHVNLTTSVAFVNAEVSRTLSYTQPGTNNLQDLSANLLANFTGFGINNSVSDVVVPTVVSVVVNNATPSVINLTFSKPINSTMPALSAFAVSAGHTLTSITYIDAYHIDLGNGTAFTNGEAARTLVYTQPGTNNVQDLAGNLLVNIAAASITNGVGAVAARADTFTRANQAAANTWGTPSDAGSNWVGSGFNVSLTTNTGSFVDGTNGATGGIQFVELAASNTYVQATVTVDTRFGDCEAGLAFGVQDRNNYYLLSTESTGIVRLKKIVNGTRTSLGSAAISGYTTTGTYVLRAERNASTGAIVAKVGGTALITLASELSLVTGTKAGLTIVTNSIVVNHKFSAFTAG